MRHSRREEEIALANSRVVEPAVSALQAAGFSASGVVRHGDVAETLNNITVENGGVQIIVGRTSSDGFHKTHFWQLDTEPRDACRRSGNGRWIGFST